MTDEIIQPASAEDSPKPEKPLESATAQTNQPAPPASEKEEVFDPERAMNTIRHLREVEKKAKADAKELERLKAEEQKRIDAQLSEVERLQKERNELAARAAQLETSMLRRDVIAEVGLPPAFADRLKGDTKEAMLEDAKSLLELLPKSKTVQTVTNPGNASINETDAQKKARLGLDGGNNIFSDTTIKEKGGGVFFNSKGV